MLINIQVVRTQGRTEGERQSRLGPWGASVFKEMFVKGKLLTNLNKRG